VSAKHGAKQNGDSAGPTTVRCAIYTRKSTERGLEQEFNSLHAQRESAEALSTSTLSEAAPGSCNHAI
jgi:hypothetical protein